MRNAMCDEAMTISVVRSNDVQISHAMESCFLRKVIGQIRELTTLDGFIGWMFASYNGAYLTIQIDVKYPWVRLIRNASPSVYQSSIFGARVRIPSDYNIRHDFAELWLLADGCLCNVMRERIELCNAVTELEFLY